MIYSNFNETKAKVNELSKEKKLNEAGIYVYKTNSYSLGKLGASDKCSLTKTIYAKNKSGASITLTTSGKCNTKITLNNIVIFSGEISNQVTLNVMLRWENTLEIILSQSEEIFANITVCGEIKKDFMYSNMYYLDGDNPLIIYDDLNGKICSFETSSLLEFSNLEFTKNKMVNSNNYNLLTITFNSNIGNSKSQVLVVKNDNNGINIVNYNNDSDINTINIDKNIQSMTLVNSASKLYDFCFAYLNNGIIYVDCYKSNEIVLSRNYDFSNRNNLSNLRPIHSLGDINFSGILVDIGDYTYALIFSFNQSTSSLVGDYTLFKVGRVGRCNSYISGDILYTVELNNFGAVLRGYTIMQSDTNKYLQKCYSKEYLNVEQVLLTGTEVYGLSGNIVSRIDDL